MGNIWLDFGVLGNKKIKKLRRIGGDIMFFSLIELWCSTGKNLVEAVIMCLVGVKLLRSRPMKTKPVYTYKHCGLRHSYEILMALHERYCGLRTP